ncbi:MAG TPA: acyltransferase [Candidatus Acidoferrales bacterium]|nr:acyltransferase [Candidatus Acidoferrales bacterium]
MHDKGPSVRHAGKLLSIQYLRGAAALSIVVYHAFTQLHRLGFRGENPDILLAGLDIFFVISGFIMWYTTFSRDIGPREFLQNRIVRIVPLYWAITSLYLFIFVAHPEWLQSTQFEFWYVAKSYLFIPAQSPAVPQIMWPLVVPGWSLNYEMFFYGLFAFTLFFAPQTRPGLLSAVLIFFICLQFFNPPSASIVGFYSSNIVLEFAFGVVLGWLYTNSLFTPSPPVAILFVMLGIGVLLMHRFIPDVPRALGYGAPALLIVAGAVFYERSGRIRKFKLPKVIGDASYSIYLSHAVVLSALSQLWARVEVPSAEQIDAWSFFVTSAVVASAICGVLVYRFLERPVLQKLSNQRMHLRPA